MDLFSQDFPNHEVYTATPLEHLGSWWKHGLAQARCRKLLKPLVQGVHFTWFTAPAEMSCQGSCREFESHHPLFDIGLSAYAGGPFSYPGTIPRNTTDTTSPSALDGCFSQMYIRSTVL